MTEEEQTTQQQVEASLGQYYSLVQQLHNHQLDKFRKLEDELRTLTKRRDKALAAFVNALLDSQSEGLDNFRQVIRAINYQINEAQGAEDSRQTDVGV